MTAREANARLLRERARSRARLVPAQVRALLQLVPAVGMDVYLPTPMARALMDRGLVEPHRYPLAGLGYRLTTAGRAEADRHRGAPAPAVRA